jgi:hypothetical protein
LYCHKFKLPPTATRRSGAACKDARVPVWSTTGLQAQVFDEGARPIVDAVLQGYNGAVIAYGQTGSGKTHTMLGPGGEIGEDASEWGLCPRAVRAVFEHVAAQDEDVEFTIVVSFVEIYMERIRDLLDPTGENLQVGEKHKLKQTNYMHHCEERMPDEQAATPPPLSSDRRGGGDGRRVHQGRRGAVRDVARRDVRHHAGRRGVAGTEQGLLQP